VAVGCTGLLQNIGARWVTRQIAAEFNLDEAQTAATRAAVDRTIAAAPAALSSKVDMLVATVDAAIAKGLTEKKLLGMERQVDALLDIVAGGIIDEGLSETTRSTLSRRVFKSGWMRRGKRSPSRRKSASRSAKTRLSRRWTTGRAVSPTGRKIRCGRSSRVCPMKRRRGAGDP
jgi:hypothetical protein